MLEVYERVDSNRAVTLENFCDCAKDLVSNDHILAFPVFRTLGHLQLVALLLSHCARERSIGRDGEDSIRSESRVVRTKWGS